MGNPRGGAFVPWKKPRIKRGIGLICIMCVPTPLTRQAVWYRRFRIGVQKGRIAVVCPNEICRCSILGETKQIWEGTKLDEESKPRLPARGRGGSVGRLA